MFARDERFGAEISHVKVAGRIAVALPAEVRINRRAQEGSDPRPAVLGWKNRLSPGTGRRVAHYCQVKRQTQINR